MSQAKIGKIDQYILDLVGNAIRLQGNWDASTNNPNISSTTTVGNAWVVSVAGSTNLGGIADWLVGDMAVKTATGWVKIDNTEPTYYSLGAITVPDFNNTTRVMSACDVVFRLTNDNTSPLFKATVPAKTFLLSDFIDGSSQYIVANYNNGSPVFQLQTTTTDDSTLIPLYKVWRVGSELHSLTGDSHGDILANKIADMLVSTQPYNRAGGSGLLITESLTPVERTLNITSSYVFAGTDGIPVGAFTSATDSLVLVYQNGTSTWLYSANQAQYDNTQKQVGNTVSTIVGAGKYSTRWFFRSIGDTKQTFYYLGDEYSTIAHAQAEAVRTDLPLILKQHCVLVGRIIIQKSASSGYVESAFATQFSASYTGDFLTGVTTDSTLTGSGTISVPLKVANPVTPLTTGFSITAGTTPKTLTVTNTASVSGTNTGDQDLSGYWKSDGTSICGGNWDLLSYSLTAEKLKSNGTIVSLNGALRSYGSSSDVLLPGSMVDMIYDTYWAEGVYRAYDTINSSWLPIVFRSLETKFELNGNQRSFAFTPKYDLFEGFVPTLTNDYNIIGIDTNLILSPDFVNIDTYSETHRLSVYGDTLISGVETLVNPDAVSTPTSATMWEPALLPGGGFVDTTDVTARVYAYKIVNGRTLYSDGYVEGTITIPTGDIGGIITSINSVTYGGTIDGGHYQGEYLWCSYGNGDAYGVVDSVDGNGVVTAVSLIDGGTGGVPSGDTTWYGDSEAITLSVSVTATISNGITFTWDTVVGADGYKVQLWDTIQGIVGDYYVLTNTNTFDYTYDLVYNIGLAYEDPMEFTPNGKLSITDTLDVVGSITATGGLSLNESIDVRFGDITALTGKMRGKVFQTSNSLSGNSYLGTQMGIYSTAFTEDDIALGYSAVSNNGSAAIGANSQSYGSRSMALNGGYVGGDSGNSLAAGYLSATYYNYSTAIGTLARTIQGKFALGTNVYASAPDTMIVAAGLTAPDTPVSNFMPSSLLIGTQTPKMWFSSNGNFLFDNPTFIDPTSLGAEKIDTSSRDKWGTSGTWQTWGDSNGHGWSNSGSSFAFRDSNGTAKGVTLFQTSENMLSPIEAGKTYRLSFYCDINSNTESIRSTMDVFVGSQHVASASARDTVRDIVVYFTAIEAGTLTFKPAEFVFVDYPTLIPVNSISLKEVTGGDVTVLGNIKSSSLTITSPTLTPSAYTAWQPTTAYTTGTILYDGIDLPIAFIVLKDYTSGEGTAYADYLADPTNITFYFGKPAITSNGNIVVPYTNYGASPGESFNRIIVGGNDDGVSAIQVDTNGANANPALTMKNSAGSGVLFGFDGRDINGDPTATWDWYATQSGNGEGAGQLLINRGKSGAIAFTNGGVGWVGGWTNTGSFILGRYSDEGLGAMFQSTFPAHIGSPYNSGDGSFLYPYDGFSTIQADGAISAYGSLQLRADTNYGEYGPSFDFNASASGGGYWRIVSTANWDAIGPGWWCFYLDPYYDNPPLAFSPARNVIVNGLSGYDNGVDIFQVYGSSVFGAYDGGNYSRFEPDGALNQTGTQTTNILHNTDVYLGITFGSEQLTNGTFTGNANGWTLGTGWAYGTNNILKNADGTGTLSQLEANMVTPIVAGNRYKLTYACSVSTGTYSISAGGVTLGTGLGTGAQSFSFKAVSNAVITVTPTNTSRITMDTFSLTRVVDGSLMVGGTILGGNAKFGKTGYSEFEDDGTLKFNGTATVFDDLLGDVTRTQTVGSRVTINATENTLDFTSAATTSDYVFLNYQNSHKWKAGSTVFPHIHWEQTSNNTPNWLFQYRWQRQGQAKTTAWTNLKCNTTNAFTYVSGTLNQISYGAGITAPANYSMSDILEFRLIRDSANASTVFAGADPYSGTVSVTAADIHYEIDSIGSRTEYTK